MKDTQARTGKRRAILILRLALVGIFLAILGWWVQPFSPRYLGKTARDWFADSAPARGIRTDVVDAFGPEITPLLIGRLEFSYWIQGVKDRLHPELARRVDQTFQPQKQAQLAVDWLTVLHHRGHSVFPLLLQAGESNIVTSILSFHTEEERERIIREHPDRLVRTQAVKARELVARWGQPNISNLVALTSVSNGYRSPRPQQTSTAASTNTAPAPR